MFASYITYNSLHDNVLEKRQHKAVQLHLYYAKSLKNRGKNVGRLDSLVMDTPNVDLPICYGKIHNHKQNLTCRFSLKIK